MDCQQRHLNQSLFKRGTKLSYNPSTPSLRKRSVRLETGSFCPPNHLFSGWVSNALLLRRAWLHFLPSVCPEKTHPERETIGGTPGSPYLVPQPTAPPTAAAANGLISAVPRSFLLLCQNRATIHKSAWRTFKAECNI